MARTADVNQLVYALCQRAHRSRSQPRRQSHRPFLGRSCASLRPRHLCIHALRKPIQIPGLLDEKALAACMAYVDLNPVRAKMAATPEQSEHTSIKQRIKKASNKKHHGNTDQQPETLFPFVGNPRKEMPTGLPFRLNDYLELVDWSGRIIREDKKGAIDKLRPSCNAWTWTPNSLSTSVRISNNRLKTWSAQRIMCVRHVRQ